MRSRARPDAGFTLIELVVVVAILGIIGFALTESVFVGLKTTDSLATSISSSIATQSLSAYFTQDAHAAQQASAGGDGCATDPGVFLQMGWTGATTSESVTYAFVPATGDDQQLVRWSCKQGSPRTQVLLGRVIRVPGGAAAEPVRATCRYGTATADVACTATPAGTPPGRLASVTLTVTAQPATAAPVVLTVSPRPA